MNDNEKVEELEDKICELNNEIMELQNEVENLQDDLDDKGIQELMDKISSLEIINKSYESESIEMRVAQMITCLSDIDLVQDALDTVRKRMVI